MTSTVPDDPGLKWIDGEGVRWHYQAEIEKDGWAGGFELVPGMRAQGKKIKKVYVESDYAPLRSVYLANASGFHIPDMDVAWDMANMFVHNLPESKEYMRKHAGKFLGMQTPSGMRKW